MSGGTNIGLGPPSGDPSPSTGDGPPRTLRLGAVVAAIVALGALVLVGRIAQPDEPAAAPIPTATPTAAPTATVMPTSAPTPTQPPTPTAAPVARAPSRPDRVELPAWLPDDLILIHGSADDPLTWIELGSGLIDGVGLRAEPLLQSGRELMLLTGDHRSVGWVSLDAPSEMPEGWVETLVARSDQPGQAWLFPLEIRTWLHMSLADGQVLERRPALGQHARVTAPWQSGTIAPGPDLISIGNQLFRWSDEPAEYTRLGVDGTVLAAEEGRALIERCSSPTARCEMGWVDAATGQPTDGPLPDEPLHSAEIAGAGRWLVAVERDNGGTELYEQSSDRQLTFGAATRAVTVSPDGRWVAWLRNGRILITDVDAPPGIDRVHRIDDLPRLEGGGRLLFVSGEIAAP